jgi:hypothetical protein
MAQVEVKFNAHSGKHNAVPGDVKKVDASEVKALENDGVASPVNQTEAKKAEGK